MIVNVGMFLIRFSSSREVCREIVRVRNLRDFYIFISQEGLCI